MGYINYDTMHVLVTTNQPHLVISHTFYLGNKIFDIFIKNHNIVNQLDVMVLNVQFMFRIGTAVSTQDDQKDDSNTQNSEAKKEKRLTSVFCLLLKYFFCKIIKFPTGSRNLLKSGAETLRRYTQGLLGILSNEKGDG